MSIDDFDQEFKVVELTIEQGGYKHLMEAITDPSHDKTLISREFANQISTESVEGSIFKPDLIVINDHVIYEPELIIVDYPEGFTLPQYGHDIPPIVGLEHLKETGALKD